jgi:hypothetical protein
LLEFQDRKRPRIDLFIVQRKKTTGKSIQLAGCCEALEDVSTKAHISKDVWEGLAMHKA